MGLSFRVWNLVLRSTPPSTRRRGCVQPGNGVTKRTGRTDLFIADEVGLGKTIEAGLIAHELLFRKKVRQIVISCPSSVLLQRQEELANRFGLQFEILDKKYLKNVRRDRGFSITPWTTHSRFLVSHRLLIDEAYTSGLGDWLGDFQPGTL